MRDEFQFWTHEDLPPVTIKIVEGDDELARLVAENERLAADNDSLGSEWREMSGERDALRSGLFEARAEIEALETALREIKNATFNAEGYNATMALVYTTACAALTSDR